jgi:hypothetical protein
MRFPIIINIKCMNCPKKKFKLFRSILNVSCDDTRDEFITKFCDIQKIYHTLTKCMRLKNVKFSDIKHDLLYNEFTSYKEHLKINLTHNNTYYTFLLRDLHKIWLNSLTKNDIMIPMPIILKNPYDNLHFTDNNLYNIYFAMLFNGMHIDPLIHLYFKCGFNLKQFLNENYIHLYEIALYDYTEQTLNINRNMYTFIALIKHAYPQHTRNIYVDCTIDFGVKRYCIEQLKPVLQNYCMLRFAADIICLNSKEEEYEKKMLSEIKKINKFIFCRPFLKRETEDGKLVTKCYYYFEKGNIIIQ